MHVKVLRAAALMAILLAVPALASAQYGHPLKGQWSGEWASKDNPSRILLDLHWDGKEITGRINPGPNAGTVTKVTIDYSNVTTWKIQMQGEGKDAAGKVVPITIEGTLENLGVAYRVFHGTWSQGGQTGAFTVTRN
jgi:hypothetical protein